MLSVNYAVTGTMYIKQVTTDPSSTEVALTFIDNVWQLQSVGYYTSSKSKSYIDITVKFSGSTIDTSASEITFNLICIDNY